MHPIADPYFYAAAIPAVILAGLSKGGFGGSMAMLAVPILALVISPIQAAGIMLPILVAMDVVGLIAYKGHADRRSLMILLPAAMAGIAVGWATATLVNEAFVRLLVGVISLIFVADYVLKSARANEARDHNLGKGLFWGAIGGFTSFVSHTGAPPFQLYMVPLRLAPTLFAGTAVIFFSVVNAVKLVPYFMLGQFDTVNLATSAMLLPLAPLATIVGVWLVRIVDQGIFYKLTYAIMTVVGIKLVWDGATALAG
ncbi:sulfite exporter TauE/SafE family protein [Roseibium polysiphoniae]|uniref:Probable membrane transporter protein n=1 Tax=Roseibium polysiphoniae TaxID=2571221 RepID=A0A944CEY4_9HYPH|nr:sulfite exporter TauE/SafE family protein [Roseibium polysiphoniae]MBS8260986.1 sulfite exporter TauE/SafE family protein [Roseibium polysiphoniae]